MNLVVALVTALTFGCSSSTGEDAGGSLRFAKGTIAQPAKKLLAGVPADAGVVGVLDFGKPAGDRLGTLGVVLNSAELAQMQREIAAELVPVLGHDILKAKTAVFFATGTRLSQWAVLMSPAPGPAGDVRPAPFAPRLSIAGTKGVYIWGTQKGVRAAKAVLDGKRPSIVSAKPKLVDWAIERCAAGLTVFGRADSLPEPKLQAAAQSFGVERLCVGMTLSDMRVRMSGTSEGLTKLAALAEAGLQRLREQGEAALLRRTTTEAVGGRVAAIFARTFLRSATRQLQPKVIDDELHVALGWQFDPATAIFAYGGVLSAVAIPAFMRYMSLSKSSEARSNVRRIAEGARNYYGANGKFPQSVGPTPPLGACCASGGKCTPRASAWANPTWDALQFAMADPHYYSYEYKAHTDDDGKAIAFEVFAYGDLDCDGVYSTFSTFGEASGATIDRKVRDNE